MILRTVVLTCVLLLPAAARAEFEEMTVRFQPHAAFFSAETSQPKPIDPQVFVQDAAAPAGTGPQGIAHAAGRHDFAKPGTGADDQQDGRDGRHALTGEF